MMKDCFKRCDLMDLDCLLCCIEQGSPCEVEEDEDREAII